MRYHLHSTTKLPGVVVNLAQARIIWEEDAQLRKGPHRIACWQVCKASSCLMTDVRGPGLLSQEPPLGRWLRQKVNRAIHEEQVCKEHSFQAPASSSCIAFLPWIPWQWSVSYKKRKSNRNLEVPASKISSLRVQNSEQSELVAFAHSVFHSSRNPTRTQSVAFHQGSFLQWWFPR